MFISYKKVVIEIQTCWMNGYDLTTKNMIGDWSLESRCRKFSSVDFYFELWFSEKLLRTQKYLGLVVSFEILFPSLLSSRQQNPIQHT